MLSDYQRTRIAIFLTISLVAYLCLPNCNQDPVGQVTGLLKTKYQDLVPAGDSLNTLAQPPVAMPPIDLPQLDDIPEDIESLDTGDFDQVKSKRSRRRRSQIEEGEDYNPDTHEGNQSKISDGRVDEDGWVHKPFVPSPTPRVQRDPLGARLPRPNDYGERNPYRYDDSQVYDPNNPYKIPDDGRKQEEERVSREEREDSPMDPEPTPEQPIYQPEGFNFIPTDIWTDINVGGINNGEEE